MDAAGLDVLGLVAVGEHPARMVTDATRRLREDTTLEPLIWTASPVLDRAAAESLYMRRGGVTQAVVAAARCGDRDWVLAVTATEKRASVKAAARSNAAVPIDDVLDAVDRETTRLEADAIASRHDLTFERIVAADHAAWKPEIFERILRGCHEATPIGDLIDGFDAVAPCHRPNVAQTVIGHRRLADAVAADPAVFDWLVSEPIREFTNVYLWDRADLDVLLGAGVDAAGRATRISALCAKGLPLHAVSVTAGDDVWTVLADVAPNPTLLAYLIAANPDAVIPDTVVDAAASRGLPGRLYARLVDTCTTFDVAFVDTLVSTNNYTIGEIITLVDATR